MYELTESNLWKYRNDEYATYNKNKLKWRRSLNKQRDKNIKNVLSWGLFKFKYYLGANIITITTKI